jgi:hypothetical protein
MSGTGISIGNAVPVGSAGGSTINALGASHPIDVPSALGGNQSLFESPAKLVGGRRKKQRGGYIPKAQNKWMNMRRTKKSVQVKSARKYSSRKSMAKKAWEKYSAVSVSGGRYVPRVTTKRYRKR